MNLRVNNLATAFGADVHRRIKQTTHAAIQENVDTGHLLTVHSKKTGILMKENDQLKQEVVLLKRNIETMKMLEKDVVQRNCSLKEVRALGITVSALQLQSWHYSYSLSITVTVLVLQLQSTSYLALSVSLLFSVIFVPKKVGVLNTCMQKLFMMY